jgi:hypothetical protein
LQGTAKLCGGNGEFTPGLAPSCFVSTLKGIQTAQWCFAS